MLDGHFCCQRVFCMIHYLIIMYEKLFSQGGLSLDRLRVLVEVADAGGISRAVSDPVRQSQYSRQLKELESFFGVELTRRDGKKLSLTSSGNQLVALVREQFRGLEGFLDSVHNQSPSFSIGAGDSLIQWLLLPRLKMIEKNISAVRFNLINCRADDIIRDLRDLKLDFGLVREDALKAGLQSSPVFKMEFALFVPKIILPNLDESPDPIKLIDRLPLAITESGAFSRKVQDLIIRKRGGFHPVLQCDSHPAVAAAVATGRFAAILPVIAQAFLPPITHHCILNPRIFAPLLRPISLAWNPRLDRINSHAEKFRKALLQHIKP
jgi:DNA-binding transcriptional LysR family regulator